MAINFTKIFQDSWNFVRNTRQITFTFSLLFFLNQIFISLFSSFVLPSEAVSQNAEQFAEALTLSPNSTLLSGAIIISEVISFLLSLWCLAAVHQVSQGNYNPSSSFSFAVKRFWGALLINVLLIAPLLLGLSDIVFSVLVSKGQPSVFSLIAISIGLYIFIRCCLASVYYLLNPVSIREAYRDSWFAGNSRVSMLFVYCLIIYFALPLMTRQLFSLSSNLIFEIIASLILAFVTVFSLVFTYRFYTLFMNKA
ncbi:TPA: hypothetical protein QB352_000243 [Pasteurella multocida]|nr:hypothetical protein [Pasteurella multocida]